MRWYRSKIKLTARNRAKSGFSLIEMMAVMSVVTALMVVFAKPSKLLLLDIPNMYKDTQSYTSLMDMVNRLRLDAENAESLGDHIDDQSQGRALVIHSRQEDIYYWFGDGQVARIIKPTNEALPLERYDWSMKRAEIAWQIHEHADKADAVEVTVSVDRQVDGRMQENFKNSFLFFTGIGPERIQMP